MNKESILFIWDRIGDYHYARVKACEQSLGMPVYTANLGSGDALYKWNNVKGARHTNLSDKSVEEKDLFARFIAFRKLIKDKKITTIAVGYGHTEYIVFLLYARLKGIRTIVFCESWYTRGTIQDYLKSLLLKTIGNGYFVSGKRAYQHFTQHYKIAPEKIYQGYSVVDNEHFAGNRSFSQRPDVLLCVARFSEEKNLAMLINAFQASQLSERYTLKIVGAGPLKASLQAFIQEPKKVVLVSWISYDDLPGLYAEAKIFILPSIFEPWGLVVNEAMAAGLPIMLSEACGCLPDVLEAGINGSSFPASDPEKLIAELNTWNTYSDDRLEQMGTESTTKIAELVPQKWSETIKEIIESL